MRRVKLRTPKITGRCSVHDHHIKPNVTGFGAIFSRTVTQITRLQSSVLNSTITAVRSIYWLMRSADFKGRRMFPKDPAIV